MLVLIGIASVQFGAGVAKSLFDEVSPTDHRVAPAGHQRAVLVGVARPRLRRRTRADWLLVAGFGVSLGPMNRAIYQSFARIPLGIAVTIEFVGPLTLAVVGSRRARDLAWVGLAAARRRAARVRARRPRPARRAFALLAGAPLGGLHPAQRRRPAGAGRARRPGVASVVAALLPTAAARRGRPGPLDPRILLLGAAVGLLSSVVPYSCELVALRSLRPAVFGILMSLEPAAAALGRRSSCCWLLTGECSAACSGRAPVGSAWPGGASAAAALRSRR